jgi:hypothetical protein
MSDDVTAPGCRRIGGGTVVRRNRHVDGSVTRSSPATTHGHRAEEDLGEEGPDRWVPVVSVGEAVTGGRPAHAWRWAREL